jgi:hypothetical protein
MARLLVLGDDDTADYHARQLAKALGRTAVVRTSSASSAPALAGFLRTAMPGDAIVPHPTMPHLLWEWLATQIRARRGPAPRGWGLPFEAAGPGGEVYLSAAAWRCPATCVEPAHCPVLHGPRDWSLAAIIGARASELGYTPAMFHVLQRAGGIAVVDVEDLLEAARTLAGRRVLVATSSHCHAAVGALEPQSVT